MPSHFAGYVVEHVPINEDTHRLLREWCREDGTHTVTELLSSLARDAGLAIAKRKGIPASAVPEVVMPKEPEPEPAPTPTATHPDHLALLERLAELSMPAPELKHGWSSRRVSDFQPLIRLLFDAKWNDERIGALLGYSPSSILEARRRIGIFRGNTVDDDRWMLAQEMWQQDKRHAALAEYDLQMPPLRRQSERLVCRDFRPVIAVLASTHHLTDQKVGDLLGYSAAAVGLERRAAGVAAQGTIRRGGRP